MIQIVPLSLFQSPLKGATIPYRPPQSHQQHQIDDSCQLQQQQQQQQQQQHHQQHFNSKNSPPPNQASSLSPTPPPSSTTSCSRTDSPIMTSYTHPMVVMTSPYLNGGGGGGGGLTGISGEAINPMCNVSVSMAGPGFYSPANNINTHNNHIPAAAAGSLYHPPPPTMPSAAPQMPTQSSQPHLVKPFLNSSAAAPMTSQYIYFPSAVPMSDPFTYSTLMSMGAGQPSAMSVGQSNLLTAAAAQQPVQPPFYPAAPFSGLEHYMNYKNGHLGALPSPSSPPFLSSPVQMNPERPMMFSSHVPDVSVAFSRIRMSLKSKSRSG